MFDTSALDLLLSGSFGRIAAGVWGALWGSFFNVLILRLPAGESVVRPPSHCRHCDEPIAWYDNIPIFSYLLLLGRCRRCRARFSPRYFLVELLICLLSLLMHQLFVAGTPGDPGLRVARFLIASLFCGVLVAVALIDLDTYRIPDVITYPGIPLVMGLSLFMGLPRFWDGLVGGVAGYLVIRLIADGYRLLTGRLGMGYGDAKLLAMVGGLLGWQVLLPVLFLASFQGAAIGISVLLLLRRRRGQKGKSGSTATERETAPGSRSPQAADSTGETASPAAQPSLRHTRIPFGPFISLAAVEALVFRDAIAHWLPFLW